MKKDAETIVQDYPYLVLIAIIGYLIYSYATESHTAYEIILYSLHTTIGFCYIVSFFLLILIIQNVIRKEFELFKKGFVIPTAIIIALGCFELPRTFNIGTTTQIGHFYEKSEYTEDYLVLVSDEPFGNPQRTIQELKGKIWRCDDTFKPYTVTDYITLNTYSADEYGLQYHLTRLYYPDGSYIYFNNESSNVLKPGGEYVVTDEYDNDYYITLTTHRWKDTQYNKKGD